MMFQVAENKSFQDIQRIVSNHVVLFNDGDFDVLYSGYNLYGNPVLGVIIGEDEDEGYVRYMHVPLKKNQYAKFLNQELALLSILQENQDLFIVDKTYTDKEKTANHITFDNLPQEYRPLENSYCPDFIYEPSFNYSISLKGKEADAHRASPDIVNVVNQSMCSFLKTSSSFLKELNMKLNVHNIVSTPGSYKINFLIGVERASQVTIFDDNRIETAIGEFLNEFYGYIINKLPNEEKVEDSEDFRKIIEDYTMLYSKGGIKIEESDAQASVIHMVYESAKEISQISFENDSFETLEFLNYDLAGNEFPVGHLDSMVISNIEEMLETDPEMLALSEPEDVDQIAKEYRIQVYNFNTHSGRGSADASFDDRIEKKVLLHVNGKKDYTNTVYTRSMDNGELISVHGIGRRVGGKLKRIVVEE